MIIGISGKIGSGKDTVARIICALDTREQARKANFPPALTDSLEGIDWNYPWENSNNTWGVKKFAGKLKQIVSILIGVPLGLLDTEEGKSYILTPDWDKHFIKHWDKRSTTRVFSSKQEALEFCASKNNSQHEFSYDGVEQLTIRKFLQLMGTECIRDIIHPNAHVNALFVDYDNYFHAKKFSVRQGITKPEYLNWIITDVRFPNEAKAIKDREGILIRVDSDYINVKGGRTQRLYPEGGEHTSETSLDNYNKWDFRILNNGTITDLADLVIKIMEDERLRLGNYSK